MGARQRDWARRVTAFLKEKLGGKCVKCGRTQLLVFDHIDPRTKSYESRAVEWSHRVSLYRREIARGEIQLLCERCNDRKGTSLPKSVDAQGVLL